LVQAENPLGRRNSRIQHEACDAFISNHPASSFAEEARTSSRELVGFVACVDAEDINTLEGYFARHPAGLRASDAREVLSKRLRHFRETKIETFHISTDIQGEFSLERSIDALVRQTLSPYGRLIRSPRSTARGL
jgi:hypothetical protein